MNRKLAKEYEVSVCNLVKEKVGNMKGLEVSPYHAWLAKICHVSRNQTSCGANIWSQEKKEPTDDTSKDVYSLLAQHVSGIIMPIVRRQTE